MNIQDLQSGPTLELAELNIYPVKSLGGISLDKAELTSRGLMFDRNWMVVTDDGTFVTQRQIPRMASIAVALQESDLILEADGYRELRIPVNAYPSGEPRDVLIHGKAAKGLDEGDDAARWLTEVLGRYSDSELRLARFPSGFLRPVEPALIGDGRAYTGFADEYPLLVISEESLQELNARLIERGKSEVPMNRFRPNIVTKGGGPFIEDALATLTFSARAQLELVKPCARCPITTVDQVHGDKPDPKEPLATLATFRKSEGGVMFGQNAIVTEEPNAELFVGQSIATRLRAAEANELP